MHKHPFLYIWIIFILLASGCDTNQPAIAPTLAAPAPSQEEPTPTQVELTPTRVEPTPTRAEPTPRRIEPTPTRAEPTPTQVEPTPTYAIPTPTRVEPSPAPTRAPSILYVKAAPTNKKDCSSWSNACDLQTALFMTMRGDKVWVAQGVYYPGTQESSSFDIESGVEIYGGFPRNGGQIGDRDWRDNPTVLSGDIGKDDLTDARGVVTDTVNIVGVNAYHVVTSQYADESAVLDGFIITAGYANQPPPRTDGFGGGMLNWSSSPTLNNIIFQGNTAGKGAAYYGGGGMFNIRSSNPVLTNVTFINNTAGGGAGMLNDDSSPTLTHVTFTGNKAIDGSCIDNRQSSPVLTDVVFDGNVSSNKGCMNNHANSNPTLTSVTFSNNSANYGAGMYNYQSSPTLKEVIFSGNTSGRVGGAIDNEDHSSPTFTDVLFTGNSSAKEGGAIFNMENCDSVFTNVAFIDNKSTGTWSGGAIKTQNSRLDLTNVTFAGNHAYFGGAIDNYRGTLSFTNITLSGNSADQFGSAIYSQESIIKIINSIIWGNDRPGSQLLNDRGMTTITYSIVQGGHPGAGNLDADPLLKPLADNGGFSPTFALKLASPAIDAGSPDNCPQTDQRSRPRPVDGNGDGIARCDIGAYEAP